MAIRGEEESAAGIIQPCALSSGARRTAIERKICRCEVTSRHLESQYWRIQHVQL